MIGTEIAFRLGPGTVDDARAIAAHLNAIATAAHEHVLFIDADVGEYGCLAVWQTRADADDYIGHPDVVAQVVALGARMGKPTRVRVYEMEYQRRTER